MSRPVAPPRALRALVLGTDLLSTTTLSPFFHDTVALPASSAAPNVPKYVTVEWEVLVHGTHEIAPKRIRTADCIVVVFPGVSRTAIPTMRELCADIPALVGRGTPILVAAVYNEPQPNRRDKVEAREFAGVTLGGTYFAFEVSRKQAVEEIISYFFQQVVSVSGVFRSGVVSRNHSIIPNIASNVRLRAVYDSPEGLNAGTYEFRTHDVFLIEREPQPVNPGDPNSPEYGVGNFLGYRFNYPADAVVVSYDPSRAFERVRTVTIDRVCKATGPRKDVFYVYMIKGETSFDRTFEVPKRYSELRRFYVQLQSAYDKKDIENLPEFPGKSLFSSRSVLRKRQEMITACLQAMTDNVELSSTGVLENFLELELVAHPPFADQVTSRQSIAQARAVPAAAPKPPKPPSAQPAREEDAPPTRAPPPPPPPALAAPTETVRPDPPKKGGPPLPPRDAAPAVETQVEVTTDWGYGAGRLASSSSVVLAPEEAPATLHVHKIVRAEYGYDAQDENELSFAQGDIIEVFAEIETGWSYGVRMNAMQPGSFPTEYGVELAHSERLQRLNCTVADALAMPRSFHLHPIMSGDDATFPQAGSTCHVFFSAFFFDGTEVDSSYSSSPDQPLPVSIGGSSAVPGHPTTQLPEFQEALQCMSAGQRVILTIFPPQKLNTPAIPRDAVIGFDIELVSIDNPRVIAADHFYDDAAPSVSRPPSYQAPAAPIAQGEDDSAFSGGCQSCNCEEYVAHIFKKGTCSSCWHSEAEHS